MSLENEVKELTAAVTNLTAMIQGIVPNVSHPVQVPVPMGENFAPPFEQPSTVEPPPAATTGVVPAPPAAATVPAPPVAGAVPAPPATTTPIATDKKGAKIVTKKRAKELSDKMVDIAKNLGTTAPVTAILHSYQVASTADLTNAQADELVQKLEVL